MFWDVTRFKIVVFESKTVFSLSFDIFWVTVSFKTVVSEDFVFFFVEIGHLREN